MILYLVGTTLLCTCFLALRLGPMRYSPARVWACVWALSFACHMAFAASYERSTLTLLTVLIGTLMYLLGATLYWVNKPDTTLQKSPPQTAQFQHMLHHSRALSHLATLGCLLTLPILDKGLKAQAGFGLLDLTTLPLSHLMEMMRASHASLSQSHHLTFPAVFKLVTLLIVVLSTLICYRLSFAPRRGQDLLNSLMLMMIALILSAGSGIRTMILIPIILGGFAFYTGCVLSGRTHVLTSRHSWALALIGLGVFGAWAVVVQSARLGDSGLRQIDATLAHMRPWIAGYLPALSIWAEAQSVLPSTYGQSLLGGVIRPLGLGSGAGFDSRFANVTIGLNQTSNAMTVFRVFLSDFGTLGAMLVPLPLGMLGEWIYHRAHRDGGVWIPLLIAQYSWVFFSINFWFFFYGARVYGVFSLVLIFWCLTLIQRFQHNRTPTQVRS